MNTTEGPKDAYVAFRKLFRSAHAWPRHDRLTNTFVHLIRKSGFRVLANAPTPNAGARSEVDFLVYGLADNKDVAFNVLVAVSDSTQVSSQNAASAGAAADLRAQHKREKYEDRCREAGYEFSPLIFEDTGFIHKSVHALVHRLSMSDGFHNSAPEFRTWAIRKTEDYWYQGLSCSLVAGNAQVFR